MISWQRKRTHDNINGSEARKKKETRASEEFFTRRLRFLFSLRFFFSLHCNCCECVCVPRTNAPLVSNTREGIQMLNESIRDEGERERERERREKASEKFLLKYKSEKIELWNIFASFS